MCLMPVLHSLGIIELAAQDESQKEMLVGSGVVEALEYGILHDFVYSDHSLAAYASGAAVLTLINICLPLSLSLFLCVCVCVFVSVTLCCNVVLILNC